MTRLSDPPLAAGRDHILAVAFVLHCAALSILQPNVSLAQETEQPFFIEELSPREQELLLHGIGIGVVVTNLTMETRDRRRLFCTPANFTLSSQEVWAAANRAMKGGYPIEYASYVSMALLDELYSQHPCGEAKSDEEIRGEQSDGVIRMLKRMESEIEKAGASRYEECVELTGSSGFCECLRDNLRWVIPYDRYRSIENSSKRDIGYASLSSDAREEADHIWAVHDTCYPLKE